MIRQQLSIDFESSGEAPSAQRALGLPASASGDSLFTKTCSGCGIEKHICDFPKTGKRCQACINEKTRNWSRKNKDRVALACKKWRTNNPDKAKLSVDNWKKRNKERSARTIKAWREKNRVHVKQYGKMWDYRNRDKRNLWVARWCEANREKNQAATKKWRTKNREKINRLSRIWCYKNKDKVRMGARKWSKLHKKECNAKTHKRRALLASAPGYEYTKARHISWRWEMWGNKCWICGKSAEATDHVIPLRPDFREKPGSHLPANLRPICKSCNSAKRNRKHPIIEMASLYPFIEAAAR